MDPLIAETAERIFADTRATPDQLWPALEQNGLTALWMPEALGGAGLGPADGFGLIGLAGRAAAAAPLTETLVASWLLQAAGLPLPPGPGSYVRSPFDTANGAAAAAEATGLKLRDGRLAGTATKVAFGPGAEWVAALVVEAGRRFVAVVTMAAADITTTGSAGADSEATVAFNGTPPMALAPAPDWLTADALASVAALARAAQMAGAMDACLDLTLAYAAQREQFGRSLSKFQAIQHLVSDMACETAAASAAVDAAVATASHDAPPDWMATAAAKIRAGEAAGRVAANAHQVHGAMGYTFDYALGQFTRRLWQWRDADGGEALWARALGTRLTAPDAPTFRTSILGGPHG